LAEEQIATLTLKGGSVLKGRVVEQNESTITLDIGFTVVRVPLSEIAGTVPAATPSNPSPPPPLQGFVKSSGDNPDAFGTEAVKLPEPATGTDKYVQSDKNTQNNTGSGAKATREVHRQPPLRPGVTQVRPGVLQERPVGVPNAGHIGVDAHFSKFGDYLQELIDIVDIQWERIVASSSISPKPSSQVTINFRINSKGQIAEILKVEGDAGEFGTNAALSAIREPAPYRAWTKEMVAALGDDQVLTFAFYYR
jgi:hypothetical protein